MSVSSTKHRARMKLFIHQTDNGELYLKTGQGSVLMELITIISLTILFWETIEAS